MGGIWGILRYLRYLWEGRRQLLERYLPDLHRNGVIQFPRLKSQATKGRKGFERKNLRKNRKAKCITNIRGQISTVWYRRTRPGFSWNLFVLFEEVGVKIERLFIGHLALIPYLRQSCDSFASFRISVFWPHSVFDGGLRSLCLIPATF